MKKLCLLLIAVILGFTYTAPASAKGKESEKVIQNYSYPIYSMETGEEVGMQEYEVVTEIHSFKNNIKELIMNTKITSTNYETGKSEVENKTQTMVFKKDQLISIDGKNVDVSDESFKITLSSSDQQKIRPIANQLKQGKLTYDEYVDKVGQLDLDLINDNKIEIFELTAPFQIAASGGLSWITYYYSSSRGGYFLKAGKMKGFLSGGLDAFMMDSSAVVSGSVITKHNYLQSDQGGLVSSFMSRADSISSARKSLLVDAAALAGALGVAVLTVTTIIGALTAAGAAGALAVRMYNTSDAAHGDIKRAYELVTQIRN